MTQDESTPKLHVDTDWKAEAAAEKERLDKQEQEKAKSDRGRPRELPEADFKGLLGVLASQAIMGLGAMGDQKSGRIMIDLEGARFSIDLLGVLQEKTKGNVTDEEANELRQVLAELRSRFVQINQLLAQQAVAPGTPGTPGIPAPGAPTPGTPGIT